MHTAALLYILAFTYNGAVTTHQEPMPLVTCMERMAGLNPNVYGSPVCINSADPKRQVTLSGPNFAERANWNTRRAKPSDENFYTDEEKQILYGEKKAHTPEAK